MEFMKTMVRMDEDPCTTYAARANSHPLRRACPFTVGKHDAMQREILTLGRGYNPFVGWLWDGWLFVQ